MFGIDTVGFLVTIWVHAFQIYPHGSTDTLPFATMGSGSLAAMSVFESKYKESLSVSKLIKAKKSCLLASI